MKKIAHQQSGFGAIEALLILIVILLAGCIGYYVWHTNYKTKATATTSSAPSKTSEATTQQQTAKTITYTSAPGGYSVQYPKQWSAEERNSTEGPSDTITGYGARFKSPDYQETSGRFPTVKTGGDFLVTQEKTTYTAINDYTNNTTSSKGITWPEEGTQTTVDGAAALRGICADVSGPNICVTFVKNGEFWHLAYYYAGANNQETATTAKYLNDFNDFVASFRVQ